MKRCAAHMTNLPDPRTEDGSCFHCEIGQRAIPRNELPFPPNSKWDDILGGVEWVPGKVDEQGRRTDR
jgi:hypothetical protein